MGTRFKKVITAAVFIGQFFSSALTGRSFAQEGKPFKPPSDNSPTMPVVVLASNTPFPVNSVAPHAEELIRLQQQLNDFARGRGYVSGASDLSSKLKSISPFQKGQLTLHLVSELYAIDPALRNSDPRGRAIYGVINALTSDKSHPDFQNGWSDGATRAELAKLMAYRQFQAFKEDVYDPYVKAQSAKKEPIIPLQDYLYRGLDLERFPVPVKLEALFSPARISENDIDRLLGTFGIPLVRPERTNPKDRMHKIGDLILHFRRFYGSDLFEADGSRRVLDESTGIYLTRAILESFSSLKSEDERKLFISWLVTDRESIAATLASTPKPDYTNVLLSFERWKKTDKAKPLDEQALKLHAELEKFPPSIQRASLGSLQGEFEKQPDGIRFYQVMQRYGYVLTKTAYLTLTKSNPEELETLKEERAGLHAWLSGLNLELPTDAEATDLNLLRALQKELSDLQRAYVNTQAETPRAAPTHLLTILERHATRSESLFMLSKRFVSRLDAETMDLFGGIEPTRPDFISLVERRINDNLNAGLVNRANIIWTTDYHRVAFDAYYRRQLFDQERHAFLGIAQLDPVVAVAFSQYYNALQIAQVASPEEELHVAQTVARLHYVSPLLAVQYLNAIKNLAQVSRGNPDAFRQALFAMQGYVFGATEPLVSGAETPDPHTIRRTITNLSAAFDMIAHKIDEGALTRYSRYQLMDDYTYADNYPPYVVRQRQPGYRYSLFPPEEQPLPLTASSPFPDYLLTTQGSIFAAAGDVGASQVGLGTVSLPSVGGGLISGQSERVLANVHAYLYPQHQIPAISALSLGTYISQLSPTQLLNEIHRAFIPVAEPEYSGTVTGGRFDFGARSVPVDGASTTGIVGLGAIMFPTGGAAVGGSLEFQPRVVSEEGEDPRLESELYRGVAGATATGVPIGRIVGKEVHIESAAGGYEHQDDVEEAVARVLTSLWDEENPGHILLSLNTQKAPSFDVTGRTEGESKRWLVGEYLYVDREGTIYRFVGGINEFPGLELLNFGALYADRARDTPTTVSANYEWEVERGGFVAAWDLDNTTSLLGHFQAVLFHTEYDAQGNKKKQPLLLEWTPAIATTEETGHKTTVDTVAVPGKFLDIYTGDDQATKERYVVQDLTYRRRVIENDEVWQISAGAGLVTRPRGIGGRAGFFYQEQARGRYTEGYPNTFGYGAYYESGAENVEALALLGESDRIRRYVESIHRIAGTIYGSREAANEAVFGGLAHGILQGIYDGERLEYDNFFFRLIGFAKGMEAFGAKLHGKLDMRRSTGFDEILADYDSISRTVAQDPRQAAEALRRFRQQYGSEQELRQIFDRYQIVFQVNDDFSVELFAVTREEANKFANQNLDTVYGRLLWTFDTGFVRAFASVPVYSPFGFAAQERQGVVGVGAGMDLLESFFLQRAAFDVGVLLSKKEDAFDVLRNSFDEPNGVFAQGAVQVFSSLVSDMTTYRLLVENFNEYQKALNEGKLADIDPRVRAFMLGSIPDAIKDTTRLTEQEESILAGDIHLTPTQRQVLSDALGIWFYDEKRKVEDRFNSDFEHFRTYVAGSVFAGAFPPTRSTGVDGGATTGEQTGFRGTVRVDLGIFAEYVNQVTELKARGYVIGTKTDLAGRFGAADLADARKSESIGGYAGIDIELVPNVTVGAIVGVEEGGSRAVQRRPQADAEEGGIRVSGGASVRYEFSLGGLPSSLTGIIYGRSENPPVYVSPVHTVSTGFFGNPEIGAAVHLSIGIGSAGPTFNAPAQPPAPTTPAGQRRGY